MKLFAVLAALLWSHFHPHKAAAPEDLACKAHGWLLENFNAGAMRHGLLAWVAGVVLPALGFGLLGLLLTDAASPLGWAFQVLVLYFCLGFRSASYHAAAAARALQSDNPAQAREALERWRPGAAPAIEADGLCRLTVEETLRAGIHNLLGVLFWFFLFGVTGAVAYRLARMARECWHVEPAFGEFAARACQALDWLPVRAAAFSFAIVGNFQDALESWRGQSHAWGDVNQGVLLAAGAGALGVQLGGTITVTGGELLRPPLGGDEPPSPETIDGAIALVLRAVLLWLAVAGLIWLGSL
jgi:adenosylcobinamide-phosphate synthase